MTVEQNITQRIAAVEAMELATELAGEFENPQHFWECMRLGILAMLPDPVAPIKDRPMTNEEAAKFGRSPMPFGAFKDQPVGDVPLERLAWYTDQDWTRKAIRYLQSPNVAAEHRIESEARQ